MCSSGIAVVSSIAIPETVALSWFLFRYRTTLLSSALFDGDAMPDVFVDEPLFSIPYGYKRPVRTLYFVKRGQLTSDQWKPSLEASCRLAVLGSIRIKRWRLCWQISNCWKKQVKFWCTTTSEFWHSLRPTVFYSHGPSLTKSSPTDASSHFCLS